MNPQPPGASETLATTGPVHLVVAFIFFVAAAVAIPAGDAMAQHSHVHKAGFPHDVPDFAHNPTIRAVKSGNWSTATTWSAGRPPAAKDVVRIPAGLTVTYDVAE